MSRIYVRDVWLSTDSLFNGIVHQDTGTTNLTCVITAKGSANTITLTITNNDANYAFTGKMHIKFYMNSVVIDA